MVNYQLSIKFRIFAAKLLKNEKLPPTLPDTGTQHLLDYHRIHHHRVVVSRRGTARPHLHDRARGDQHTERTMVVRTRMPQRQYVRPAALEIFAPQADTGLRAHIRLPPVHGVLHLRHVRRTADADRALERGRMGHVERHRTRVLDHHRDDHWGRRRAELHLCAENLVLLLSDGDHLPLGSAEESSAAQSLHEHPRDGGLPDEVQELRPRMPDAANALRQSGRGEGLSGSRLSEMRQMRAGLSDEDYDPQTLTANGTKKRTSSKIGEVLFL